MAIISRTDSAIEPGIVLAGDCRYIAPSKESRTSDENALLSVVLRVERNLVECKLLAFHFVNNISFVFDRLFGRSAK